MLAWAIYIDGKPEGGHVFAETHEEALKRIRHGVRGITAAAVRDPSKDWLGRYYKIDKDLWHRALYNIPNVHNFQKNQPFETERLLHEFFGINTEECNNYWYGRTPTPDNVRVVLRKLAGPHGKLLATMKLKQLGYTLEDDHKP